jgi:hypothetical protein
MNEDVGDNTFQSASHAGESHERTARNQHLRLRSLTDGGPLRGSEVAESSCRMCLDLGWRWCVSLRHWQHLCGLHGLADSICTGTLLLRVQVFSADETFSASGER